MSLYHMLLAALVAAFWGGNFVAAKLALHTLPPFFLLALRFIMTAALLLPFVKPPRGAWRQIMLLSSLLGVLHFSLMFVAIWWGLDVPSAIIATQLGVPFSCLLGTILFHDVIGRWRALGMLVAFAGVVVILGTPRVIEHFGAFTVSCSAAFAWAVANIVMKRIQNVPIFALLAYLSLFAVPQLLVLSFLFEHGQKEALFAADSTVWLALAYTVVCSTIGGYGIWYYLLGRFPVSQVTPFSMLVPVFGIASAQAFFHQPMTPTFIVGGGLTLIGVAIILIRRPQVGILEK